ncbi:hypothetical protein B7463_g3368, partial [Scytalidium lignicola]
MKGRNRRPGSRRSLRQARRAASKSRSIVNNSGLLSSNVTTSSEISHLVENSEQASTAYQNQIAIPGRINRCITSELPFPPHPNLRLDCLGMKLDSEYWQVFHEFSTFLTFKNAIYPGGRRMDLEAADIEGMQWLFSDAPFLHSIRFSTSAMLDITHRRPPSSTTWSYLRRATALLMARLNERDTCLTDSTVYIVSLLALTASLFGDHAATEIHLAGLHQMIHILGGRDFLHCHPMLHFKVSYLDLSLYLSTGWKPRYFAEISWASTFGDSEAVFVTPSDSQSLRGHVESRLAVVFRDLQILTSLINEKFRQHRLLRITELQEHIDSIQVRLLQLEGTVGDSLSESIRLGMLAFLFATFEFPQNKEQLRYLADRFYHSYLRIGTPCTQLSHLMF